MGLTTERLTLSTILLTDFINKTRSKLHLFQLASLNIEEKFILGRWLCSVGIHNISILTQIF